jgi:hypothetical protein
LCSHEKRAEVMGRRGAAFLLRSMQLLSTVYVGAADLLHVYNACDKGLTALFRIEIRLGISASLIFPDEHQKGFIFLEELYSY